MKKRKVTKRKIGGGELILILLFLIMLYLFLKSRGIV